MKKGNIIQNKSFDFAVSVVKLCKHLTEEKKEFVMSKQLIRSGTSVGANIEEAIGAQSDKDFLHKFSIAYKEARESMYWVKLLHATNYLTDNEFENLSEKINEICKIIGSIQITMKAKMKTRNS